MPKQCTQDDVREKFAHKFIRMAQSVNWTDVTVDFYFASQHDDVEKSTSTLGYNFTLLTLGILVIISICGTIVELTSLCDKKGLNKEKIKKASAFVNIKQYDTILVQRKNGFGRGMLLLSGLRNIIKMGMAPRAYQ